MLKKLLGGKKNDFYLQIDESQEESKEAAAPVATTAEAPVATTSTETPKAETAAPAPKVPAPEVPFWVSAMRSTAAIQAETKAEMTFSTDYLLSSGSSSRRRPGPSLNPFKDMAREVKKPIK